ncbi:MAG: hypothetical protein M3289_04625 [Actinomycetota bacterium]|nr:hypothetical protein [Rubrobacter sp.]MDQ5813989.1 hypothetical protein [Actinomycetota bacterium]
MSLEEKGARTLRIRMGSPRARKARAEERSTGFPLLSGFGPSCGPKGRELTR